MHAGEINLHRLINADRALDRQLPAPAPPPPSFCVGNLQRRQTPFSWRERGEEEEAEEEERKKKKEEEESERERGKWVEDRGVSAEEKREGRWAWGGGWKDG